MLNAHWPRHLFYTWLLARYALLCCLPRQKAIFPLLPLIVSLHITEILIAFFGYLSCPFLSFNWKDNFRQNEGSCLFPGSNAWIKCILFRW